MRSRSGSLRLIASVQNRIISGRQVTIELSEINNHGYFNYPQNRPNGYSFGMTGNATNSIMNSPVFSKSLATQIINNCNSISSVSFGLWQSGWVEVYGLMPNREIKMFECPEDFDVPYYRDFEWGEHCSM